MSEEQEAPTEVTAPESDPAPDVDLAAEVEKWKSLARKHEGKWKEAQKDSAELQQQIAAAKLEAALTGVLPDPAAIVSTLDLGRFVTDTGDVNQEAVTAIREQFAALAPPAAPNLHQGRQGQAPSAERDFDYEIREATKRGDHISAIALKQAKAEALSKQKP